MSCVKRFIRVLATLGFANTFNMVWILNAAAAAAVIVVVLICFVGFFFVLFCAA